MPVITDIKQQKRIETRYSVYLDGRYAFSLSDLELSSSNLRVRSELTPDEVELWQAQSLEGKAYAAALRYIAYRRRSERELTDYLRRKEYEAEVIEPVLERLREVSLIDDRAFAAAWIADRQLLRPRSRRVLEQELLKKGIDRELAHDALAELDDDDQATVLMNLIERKRRLTQYQDPQKLLAYLGRQGFGYAEIKKALARLDD
jgi:regulatory protein